MMKYALLSHWYFMVQLFQDLKEIQEIINKEGPMLSGKIREGIFKRRKQKRSICENSMSSLKTESCVNLNVYLRHMQMLFQKAFYPQIPKC